MSAKFISTPSGNNFLGPHVLILNTRPNYIIAFSLICLLPHFNNADSFFPQKT